MTNILEILVCNPYYEECFSRGEKRSCLLCNDLCEFGETISFWDLEKTSYKGEVKILTAKLKGANIT